VPDPKEVEKAAKSKKHSSLPSEIDTDLLTKRIEELNFIAEK
jgi:hypothetical protein